MSGNLFGEAFRVMTFGESHGKYIGVVIDGIMPGIPLDTELIQKDLDRRRPGQSEVTTKRKEEDKVEIISGIFEGKTTGTPICLLIKNKDPRSQDYNSLKNILRPGHASFTFLEKYGIFDYRGGGRASGRETASRVATGGIAKQLLEKRNIQIKAYSRQIGNIQISKIDLKEIDKNVVRAPDKDAANKMRQEILKVKKEGDSLGGIIEILVKNCPKGLGEPVFHKLEADLASALMSIGAVKGFEIGSGFQAAILKGSEQNDSFYFDEKQKRFRTKTNHAGGVLGGITNGEDLVMRIAIKPPSSIQKKMETVDKNGKTILFGIEGRHDPCICPRIVPVAEAMVALVLIDHILMQDRISSNSLREVCKEKIETIDNEFLLLLKQRLKLVEIIAQAEKDKIYKKGKDYRKHNFQDWLTAAKDLNLPEEMIKKIFTAITNY